MNLTISKEQIISGLQSVQNVVSNRTTLPILSNVLLRAEGERLELTATDLDVTIACAVEAKVKKPGGTTVPVKRLFGIVRELANADIDLEVDDKNVCSIRSGPSFYKINGLSADEFPPLQKFKEDKKVVMQDLLCHFNRRVSIRAQRHLFEPEGPQDDHGCHRRETSGTRR